PRPPAVTSTARRYLLILVAVALGATALVRTGVPPYWVFPVHRAVTETMSKQGIPGMSVAVASGGRIRWAAGYGLADVENHVAARTATVYRMASISKPITA